MRFNFGGMDPYRAPREPEPPPVDAMRTILFVAGGIAALLVIGAIVVAIADGRRVSAASEAPAKPIPTPSVIETETAAGVVAPPPNVVRPPPPNQIMPLDEPLAFEAETSPCFGTCESHTTRIGVDGSVTVKRHYTPCAVASDFRVDAAERAALASEARALHLHQEFTSYVYMTDVQRLVVRVEAGTQEWTAEYLPPGGPDYGVKLGSAETSAVAAIAAFHDHVERAAGTARWLSGCRVKHVMPR